jgi:hypothetical protein
MKWLTGLICLILMGVCVPAHAKPGMRGAFGGLFVSGVCSRGTGLGDGCPGANTGSTVQRSNFFTSYAAQSGQTGFVANRPTWNVAGVEYPVGYYTPLSSLTDVSTTSAYLTSVGCTFASSTHTWSCTGSGVFDLEGTRWDLNNGTVLWIKSSATYSSVIIKNNFFACGTSVNLGTGGFIRVDNIATDLDVEFNTFEGYASPGQICQPSSVPFFIQDLRIGTNLTTYKYNAFLDLSAKGISGTALGAATLQYNYVENINTGAGQHGEWFIAANGTYTGAMTFDYNTFLQNASNDISTGGTATNIFLTNGSTGTTIPTFYVRNNVFISNTLNGVPGGTVLISAVGAEMSTNTTYTTGTISNNYLDKTGGYSCWYQNPGSGTISFSGNILLTTGASANAFGNAC